jgi:outer membrane protein OmpA-like peptidoglycan-associated protein
MKLTNLFLASTALPLMMLSANASAPQPQISVPITLAQAEPAEPGQLPPRVRPRQGQDEGGPPGQQRRQRPGADDEGGRPRPQRGGQDAAPEAPAPRAPRATPDEGTRPAQRPGREQRQPVERQEERQQRPERPTPPSGAEPATPARPGQAPAERAQPPRPAQEQRDQRPGDRPRQQSPDTPARPNTPPAGQARPTPEAPRPADTQRPAQQQGTPATDTQPSTSPATPSTPSAPAPATRPESAPAPVAPTAPRSTQPPAPTSPTAPQAAPAPRAAAPLDPSRVRIEDLRSQRRERREGNRLIIEEPGNRTIIREGNEIIIRHDESERFRRIYGADEVRVERRGGNEEVTIVRRPDGSEIVSVRDEYGNLIRRVRREPAGREVVLIENRRSGIGIRPGYGYVEEEVLRLPPPRVTIPRERYIVETERASEADIVEAFTAPPVERVERAYTLDEVRRSEPLRERMRRVDVDTINFEFGSWELPPDQVNALRVIADGLRQAISRNPNEIFLVEGHTDAVGSDEDNLTLSDRRAETVATIMTQQFQIPAENLTTQGYGEQYLKVNTQGPEAENRRVTMRRITPLLQGQNQ